MTKVRSARLQIPGCVAAAVLAATASTCPVSASELSATPASLTAVFESAQPGDTIRLASGSYVFAGGMKSDTVTLRPQLGAVPMMKLRFRPASNITIDGVTLTDVEITDRRSKNITVRNSDIPGQVILRTGELQNANILFDHNVHRDWDKCLPNCAEGRVWLPESTDQPSGITISNGEFRGGQSDGIQNGSNGTRIINNVFHDLIQGDPDLTHTDSIQLYGSKKTLIKGNYFYDVPTAIMSPDGADHETIEDNVIAADPDGYPYAISLGSDDGSTVVHNTFADGSCAFNLRCGIIAVGRKGACPHAAECDASRGTVIKDNILGGFSIDEGQGGSLSSSYNLIREGGRGSHDIRGIPTFVGGARPTSYGGYALITGSPGTASASDGSDRGARIDARPPAGMAHAPTAKPTKPMLRVLSRLGAIRATGRLRLEVRQRAAGAVVLAGSVRPGRAVNSGRPSRVRIGFRSLVARFARPGKRVVSVKFSRRARRTLGRARDARLNVRTYSDAARSQATGAFSLRLKR